jgi:thiol-disulfide isomerase/thioredoxin
MTDKKGVVTLERFNRGMTYQQYVSQISTNREQFDRNYREFALRDEDVSFFTEVNSQKGGLKVLVLGEEWCPDVYRGLPIMARIAEAAGMELRVFPRDRNRDIMDLYLNQGVFMSIPVFAFFDSGLEPLCHWIERPAIANEFMRRTREELAGSGLTEEEQRAERTRRQQTVWDAWRQETVQELRDLLQSCCAGG